MKLAEVASKLGCRLEGQADIEITGVAGMEQAGAGELTFLANKRYVSMLKSTKATAVLLEDRVKVERDASLPPLTALRSENPYLAFAQAIELFYLPPRYAPGIHPTAIIATSAKIGPGAHIGPYCYVAEDVVIGARATLHSFVTIYQGAKIGDDFFAHAHAVVRELCSIGNRVILQNGVIIGADGFGFAKRKDSSWYKIVQSGPVVIEDDVEIQSNACVDRATIGETRIARGAKLDNLVMVGHGSQVGANTLLCAQVGLAGSTKVGRDCILAGQVGSGGHLTIGDRTLITAQSGIPHDLEGDAHYSGSPCVSHKQWLKNSAAFSRMPELQRKVRELEAEIAKLRTAG
jgi:UDP-3-O-[3-hydroxymyristoyl] glucosamine N-acyltransferase